MSQEVRHVLSRVARRQQIVSLGRHAFAWTLVLAAALGLAVLATRLLGLWEDPFASWFVALVPVLGLLGAALTHRRPAIDRAARTTDEHMRTEDLFLTTLGAERAPGEFRELVVASARSKAGSVPVAEVVPWTFAGRLVRVAVALVLVFLVAAFVPQFDPFGGQEELVLLAKERERLEQDRERTAEKRKRLAEKSLEERNSEPVRSALEEAVLAFRKLERQDQRKNAEDLARVRQKVGNQWREARSKSAQRSPASPTVQSLGSLANREQRQEWRKDLKGGDAKSLRRELKALQDLLKQLQAAPDAGKREELRKELEARTKDLADFLKSEASSSELQKSLSQALDQLQAMSSPKLAEAAQEALKETLELTEQELQRLAQSLRDLGDLEQALKALQAARQANEKGCCQGGKGGSKPGGKDGQDAEGQGEADRLRSMEEYEQYYRDLLARGEGQQKGQGMGGPGQGEGNVAPENSEQKNEFKTEKALSALTAGKQLMNLKTREVGDKAKVEREYAEKLERVKQGVDEAILQERVPPGYHDGVQKYFDDLGETPKPKPKDPKGK